MAVPLLLGADAVQFHPDWLQQANRWLAEKHSPALPGTRQRWRILDLRRQSCFCLRSTGPASTTAAGPTARDFRARMKTHGEWRELPGLTDLDRIEQYI